uniref:Alpha/beta hydrolase fold-3 domain-containing protein n=1 Tax=Ditylenchus dipsaci TaxID=166011 RepID=A0A915DW24_9BILA
MVPSPGGKYSWSPVQSLFATRRAQETNAAVIYIHGGGWCIMRPKFYDEPLLALIERLGCPVISIDYHLSPEAKFPSAILECERVVQEIHDNKFKDYNIDPNRIALMGDSAGGNISAVLCQRALRQKRVLAKCQVLVYPVIHLLDTLSPAYRHYYSTYKGSSLLNPKSLIRWYLMYLGIEATQQNIKAVMRNQHIPKELKEDIGINRLIDTSSLPTALLDKKSSDVKLPSPSVSTNTELAHKMKKFLADPNLCPLLGKDLTGLPPAMIVTAGVDILRDEGVLYARRMRDFGVPVQWSHYEA